MKYVFRYSQIKGQGWNGGVGWLAFRRENTSLMAVHGEVMEVVVVTLSCCGWGFTACGLRYNHHFKSPIGWKGWPKECTDAVQKTIVQMLKVQLFVMLRLEKVITDLIEHGQEFIVAHGGRGGRGSYPLRHPKILRPEISENGEPGQGANTVKNPKILADVGFGPFSWKINSAQRQPLCKTKNWCLPLYNNCS